jgi:hypothetical protein
MALSEYRGPSNCKEIFQHLVGEKIVACFEHDRHVWIVVDGNHAFVIGGSGFAVYRHELPAEVQRLVAQRRKAIERHNAELRDMAGVTELG